MRIEYFNFNRILQSEEIVSVVRFLHKELGRFGDSCDAITKAIRYAMDDSAYKGGLVAIMFDMEQIVGVVVINRTGMEDYIPENILVYVAVCHKFRSQGLGKLLLLKVIKQIKGDLALHVEPTNPAIRLYRSLGFDSKYIEMRLYRKESEWLI